MEKLKFVELKEISRRFQNLSTQIPDEVLFHLTSILKPKLDLQAQREALNAIIPTIKELENHENVDEIISNSELNFSIIILHDFIKLSQFFEIFTPQLLIRIHNIISSFSSLQDRLNLLFYVQSFFMRFPIENIDDIKISLNEMKPQQYLSQFFPNIQSNHASLFFTFINQIKSNELKYYKHLFEYFQKSNNNINNNIENNNNDVNNNMNDNNNINVNMKSSTGDNYNNDEILNFINDITMDIITEPNFESIESQFPSLFTSDTHPPSSPSSSSPPINNTNTNNNNNNNNNNNINNINNNITNNNINNNVNNNNYYNESYITTEDFANLCYIELKWLTIIHQTFTAKTQQKYQPIVPKPKLSPNSQYGSSPYSLHQIYGGPSAFSPHSSNQFAQFPIPFTPHPNHFSQSHSPQFKAEISLSGDQIIHSSHLSSSSDYNQNSSLHNQNNNLNRSTDNNNNNNNNNNLNNNNIIMNNQMNNQINNVMGTPFLRLNINEVLSGANLFATPSRPSDQSLSFPPSKKLKMNYKLKVVQQPKDGVVYQRILKPHPTVSLISWEDDDVTLVVEASAVRSDTEEPLLDSLEGNKIACISKDTFASFSKLKISHTSRKIGTNFKIKFSLMKYANSASIPEPTGAFVLSNAFEVFSHSQYIRPSRGSRPSQSVSNINNNNNNNNNNANNSIVIPSNLNLITSVNVNNNLPEILEIIPPSSRPSVNLILIGRKFERAESLVVNFGEQSVKPIWVSAGTLKCSVPHPIDPSLSTVSVTVSNNGSQWSNSVLFTFLSH